MEDGRGRANVGLTLEPSRRAADGKRTAVLIVDDIAENLFALSQLLCRDDIDLLTARSGRDALELLLTRAVAVAIIDVQMPEMDGFELATLMRGVDQTRHVPIIFVTAIAKDERRAFAGYEAGAVDFLHKPIDGHVLKSKVDVFITLEQQRQELRRSEERFRSLVEATSQAVWRTTADCHVAEDSPSFRELTGMNVRDWLEGRWLDVVHPEDRRRVVTAWRGALRARSSYELEFRIRRPEGHYTWTLVRVAPVFDEQGELIEWIGANTDIQARKEAERLREMFIAILGHDLRNPLGAILTATQLALTRTQEESVRSPLARVLSSGERMVRMIEQLLDLTRVRLGGGIELHPVVADLRAVVSQALSETVTDKDQINVNATGDTRGSWDLDRLFQVVTNLLSNAIGHSPPETKVHISLDGRVADAVILAVHNLGPAIPDEQRAVLFEPFRGATRRKAAGGHGLGLGLFITKQLVLAHGGSITCESADDKGTVFTVTLPRHRRAHAPSAGDHKNAEGQGG
jgi:PAS domain S-box-containing protein